MLLLVSIDPKIFKQKLEFIVAHGVLEVRLRKNSHEAGNLQLIKVLNTSLKYAAEEVLRTQNFDVLLLFEFWDDSDNLIRLAKDIMDRPTILNELLRKLSQDLLRDIQHLILGYCLLLVLLILVSSIGGI